MSSSWPERYAKAIRLVRVTLAAVRGGGRMARHEGSGLASEPMSRAHGRTLEAFGPIRGRGPWIATRLGVGENQGSFTSIGSRQNGANAITPGHCS